MNNIGWVLPGILVIAGIVVGYVLFIKRRKQTEEMPNAHAEEATLTAEILPATNTAVTTQPTAAMMNLVRQIELENRFGDKLTLSNISSTNSLTTRKFQEITARGTSIGAGLVQGSLPALAQVWGQTQTLAEIAKAAPNGLFTSTAPLAELMKYKDGTIGSIVMNNGNIVDHAGFQSVAVGATQALNPAVVVGAGMQAMAMISGQYYMHNISKQLEGIERGIDKLIGFHHDSNIGRLRSIENVIKGIVDKQHVDDTDIVALQAGGRDADSILIEYSSRLERLGKTGEITEINVRTLFSRLSATKEIQNLSKNAEEQELFYSFQICLFASKLKVESKKAEFATRMKMGETDKAVEVFNAYRDACIHSFINDAPEFLDSLFDPIHEKAKSLISRQWFDSKESAKKLDSIGSRKSDLSEFIGLLTESEADNEVITNFNENREILYLPGNDGAEQRVFISVE